MWYMDITGLSVDSIPTLAMGLTQMKTLQTVNTALVGIALDTAQVQGDSLTKMMEQSVNPSIGGNIDVSV